MVKQKAAVLPAKNKVTKVIPTKAVDEWPEGNDLRPSRIWLKFLRCMSNGSVEILSIRTQCRHAAKRPICIELESLGGVDLDENATT